MLIAYYADRFHFTERYLGLCCQAALQQQQLPRTCSRATAEERGARGGCCSTEVRGQSFRANSRLAL